MGRLDKGFLEVAKSTAIGCGIGYMAFCSPLKSAGLAACIATVSQVTNYIFKKAFENTRFDIWNYKKNVHENNVIRAVKLVVDTTLGTLVAFGISIAILGAKWTALPVIHLLAFTILIEYGRGLASSIYYLIKDEFNVGPVDRFKQAIHDVTT